MTTTTEPIIPDEIVSPPRSGDLPDYLAADIRRWVRIFALIFVAIGIGIGLILGSILAELDPRFVT